MFFKFSHYKAHFNDFRPNVENSFRFLMPQEFFRDGQASSHNITTFLVLCQFFCKIINFNKLSNRKLDISRLVSCTVYKNMTSNLQQIWDTADSSGL